MTQKQLRASLAHAWLTHSTPQEYLPRGQRPDGQGTEGGHSYTSPKGNQFVSKAVAGGAATPDLADRALHPDLPHCPFSTQDQQKGWQLLAPAHPGGLLRGRLSSMQETGVPERDPEVQAVAAIPSKVLEPWRSEVGGKGLAGQRPRAWTCCWDVENLSSQMPPPTSETKLCAKAKHSPPQHEQDIPKPKWQ